ncbi:MAG: AtpZ/AtpI family protein [Acidimicrobiia bacterium]
MSATQHRGEMIRGWSSSGDVFTSVLAGLLIGLGLDYLFGTRPLFTVLFVVVAAIGAFAKLWTNSSELEKQAEQAIRSRDGY